LAKTLGQAYQTQRSIAESAINNLDAVYQQVSDLNNRINGDICSGGAHGEPSPVRGGLSAQATAISAKLSGVRSDLQGAASLAVDFNGIHQHQQ
jgi:hypothetical protein